MATSLDVQQTPETVMPYSLNKRDVSKILHNLVKIKLQVKIPYMDTGASQGGLVVKNLPANAGDLRDADPIPGSGRSPGGGHGNPFQYSRLENLLNRGAWWRHKESDRTE